MYLKPKINTTFMTNNGEKMCLKGKKEKEATPRQK